MLLGDTDGLSSEVDSAEEVGLHGSVEDGSEGVVLPANGTRTSTGRPGDDERLDLPRCHRRRPAPASFRVRTVFEYSRPSGSRSRTS